MKGLQCRSDFPPKNRIVPLSNSVAKRSKDSRFSSYLPIENPSKQPRASCRRKLKSHSIRDFRLEGTRRNVNLLTFLLRSLRAERCDFWGENRSGTGALSKRGFHPCPSIRDLKILWTWPRRTSTGSEMFNSWN